MIEPQNTMLPVAEPRPVDTPQGEGEGFGAMLAQSLGLAPQVDPNAVQQINTNQQHRGHGQEGAAGEQAAADEQSLTQPLQRVVGTALSVPVSAAGVVPDQGGAAEQSAAAQSEPVFSPVRAGGSQRFTRTDQGVAPLPTLPTPPSAEAAPHVVRPIDTIWKPSPLGNAGEAVAADAPANGEMTWEPVDRGDAIWKPGITSNPAATPGPIAPTDESPVLPTQPPAAPTAAPGFNPPDPAAIPIVAPLADEVAPPAATLEPTVATPGQVGVDRGRQLPEPPALDSNAPGEETATSLTKPAVPGPVAPAAAATPQRVELAPDRPVRLDTAPVPTAVDSSTATAEPAVAPVTQSAPADGGPGMGTVQTAGSAPAAPSSAAAEGMQPQASALAERVMQAIDLQRTQPPPRSMVVDIPELEGLRLVVSVRSAGHVSVTPAGNTANPDVFTPFATDLSRVLAERGFVMNGDSRRQGSNPYDQDEAPPAPRRSTGFRRTAPVDNDLRI